MKRSKNPVVRFSAMQRKPLLGALDAGVIQVQIEEEEKDTRTFNEKPLLDMGRLGSLRLSDCDRYKRAISDAVARYGCTFPTSSQWIRHPFWVETTKKVEEAFGWNAVLTRSTGLANMAFFSTFVRNDPSKQGCNVILDKDAHASLRDVGASVGGVKPTATLQTTFDVKELEQHIEKLNERPTTESKKNSTPGLTWYVADGMGSMTGEIMDVDGLFALQRKYPDLWVYCDDAHGSGWSGKDGIGLIPEAVIREAKTNDNGYAAEARRWVFGVCFGKSFGADGGALILPSPEMKDLVHALSPFCTFTCTKFPIADLALINEAMSMSLDGTMDDMQAELSKKVDYLHTRAKLYLTDLVDFPETSSLDETPVLFVPIDRDVDTFFRIIRMLQDEGIFVATCAPPATSGLGVRITVKRENTHEEIDRVLLRLRELLGSTIDFWGMDE